MIINGVEIQRLDTDRNGKPRATLNNFVEIASQHPDFESIFSYDEMSGTKMTKIEFWEDNSVSNDDYWNGVSTTARPLQDLDYATVMRWFERNVGSHFSKLNYVQMAIDQLCQMKSYDPLKNYLNDSHKNWIDAGSEKTIEYLPLMDMTLTEASTENVQFVTAVLRCWLVSAVARAFEPGIKVDSAIILEGPQGAGKSSFYRALAGDEWFRDSLPPMGSKDASDALRGKWIVELAELSSLKRSETEEVKAFITRTVERYRPPYGRNEIKVPRRCVFGGSTNADNYLKDASGNRRFWPFSVERINFKQIGAMRDSIWGEAVNIYKQWAENRLEPTPWLLPKEYEAHMEDQQRGRVHVDSWVSTVAEIIKTTFVHGNHFRLNDVAEVMDLRGKDFDKAKQMRLADAIKETGLCTKQRDRYGNKYIYSNPEALTDDEKVRKRERDYFKENDEFVDCPF